MLGSWNMKKIFVISSLLFFFTFNSQAKENCDDLYLGYPNESGLSEGSDNAYDIIKSNFVSGILFDPV